MGRWRVVLAVAGIGLGLYGVGRLLTGVNWSSLALVGLWLILALVIHDGLLSPAVLAVAALLGRIPPRARRYLQAGLIMAALVTVIALPMINQQRRQPPSQDAAATGLRGQSDDLARDRRRRLPGRVRGPGGPRPAP